MPRLLTSCLLLLLATTAIAAAAEDYDGWWPDPYEVAHEEQAAQPSSGHEDLTPEQRRAIHEYLAKHADRDGDGDFDADDIEQFERTGDISMLRDGDLMGGYFGSGDEFIRDGVEHEVNGGRYLRGSMDRAPQHEDEDGERVAKLDLFGMRGFLSDEGTYSNPSDELAGSQFIQLRMQVARIMPGYMPPADYSEMLRHIEEEQQAEEPAQQRHQPVYEDDDPTVWW